MEGDRISALKRSFEVEEVDTPTYPSLPSRRTANPLLRSAVSSSAQRFQDLGTKHSSELSTQQSPKTSLRRVELTGPRLPEAASRRTEISIDISSKQVENISPGVSRFGLRRPEAPGHKSPELVQKRAEISVGKPQESPLRRTEPPFSRIPDPHPRKTEFTTAPQAEVPSKRVEVQDTKPAELSAPARSAPNNLPAAISVQQSQPQPADTEILIKSQDAHREDSEIAELVPEVIPCNTSTAMAEPSRDPATKPVLSVRGERPPPDFNYVGIDAILEQMRRKAMKQGFQLNIMVVGQSGLGKSTLVNTLFKSKVSRRSMQATAEERIPKTIEIKSVSHDIEEKGVRMKLTVIDTPGFGDHINNENCWQPIMKFINDQYEKYLQEELNINRKRWIPDSRVHCCIYFIPPTGHSLRPLDVEFMRRLSKVVNIVPVIAKADTLTLEERDFFKQKIREELGAHGIDVYPQKEFDEDTEDRMINEKIREMIPFAVVGSDQEYQVNGRRILGRKTKWGTIEVENIAHCEFAYLRDLLIRTHMQNIKDITSSIHYEMYRVKRLNESTAYSNGVSEQDASTNEM
ncbi:septin-9-like isoform X1 [Acipenser oxyrinchus oxyrinchus]|uniref:Septin-9-like isoform X1 n=1 Tax=Acipenser oxyrinchus oxyrinchus TaxID=40147 RepID=A0AAD8D6X3_ACIOX|nr:septin-9-like isoform X1 [Acipenser oxyrinchus oxyrinchus]